MTLENAGADVFGFGGDRADLALGKAEIHDHVERRDRIIADRDVFVRGDTDQNPCKVRGAGWREPREVQRSIQKGLRASPGSGAANRRW